MPSHAGNGVARSCWQRCYRVLLAMELVESCWWRRCRGNIGHGVMYMLSHASDGAIEAWCRCRVMLTTMLSSHVGYGTAEVTLPWHDIDVESCRGQCWRVLLATGAIEVTWPQRDVDAESCWWQWCWFLLATALLSSLVRYAMWMWNHASDNATESWWRRRCHGDLAMVRCRCWVMLATMVVSHASEGIAEATWPWRGLGVKSCCVTPQF
jgi:hypothetical protein